jgi:hypothetical protein
MKKFKGGLNFFFFLKKKKNERWTLDTQNIHFLKLEYLN